jgi:Mor family transcriptional regulator
MPRQQKLTTQQRTEIGYRRMEGEKVVDLAREYGVSIGIIYGISKVDRP